MFIVLPKLLLIFNCCQMTLKLNVSFTAVFDNPMCVYHIFLILCVKGWMSLCLFCVQPQVHDGSLTILGITRDDRGAYTCRAYSDQGEVLHTTRLLVQGTVSIK